MRSFQKLYKEIQLGEKADLTSRILHAVTSAMGSFRHRLPAREMTSAEFIKTFVPGRFETAHEFLEEHATKTAAWKSIPSSLIPDGLVAEANDAVAQKFSFLGASFHFHENIDWHHSLGPGGSWPRGHWSEIPFSGIKHLGDIKPCWEMNRHQFFVTLALAWLKTGDAKYAQAVVRFLNSWCDQNTPETGVNYISGADIGLRCVSWILADRLLKGCPVYDELTQERLHRNILSQARHIAEYLSYTEKKSSNNHLLAEAVALAWISLCYPEFSESADWEKRALTVLWPALDAQVYPDGMHFECSFGYHLQAVEFLLLLFTETRRRKKPVPAKAYAILEKMVTALHLAVTPDGGLPPINDSDDGRVMPAPFTISERLAGVFAVAAVLYDRPDFKAAANHIYGLYAHLLLGESGAEEFRLIAELPLFRPTLSSFNSARIHIVRDGGDYMLLKNNPDPFPHSGHNHADLLNILLWLDGKPVLSDAGTYKFSDAEGLRNALRATAAHNTVTVDRVNQSEPLRNFDWMGQTKPGNTSAEETDHAIIIDAQHDCYGTLGVTHRRVLVWLKAEKMLIVADQMLGKGTHSFEQHWHFAPGTVVEDSGTYQYKLAQDGKALGFMRFLRDKDLDSHEQVEGEHKSASISATYGEVCQAPVLRHSWMSTLTPEHASLRLTVFSHEAISAHYQDVWQAECRFGAWNIDLNQFPAKVAKARD